LSADPAFTDIVRRSNIAYEKRQAEKRQRMLDSTHPHVKVVNIVRVACPTHILKLKTCLGQIAPFETLRIIPGTLAVLTDLTAACRALGHAVEQVDDANGSELYVTRSY
jgi:TusA-related sulfurtransferase